MELQSQRALLLDLRAARRHVSRSRPRTAPFGGLGRRRHRACHADLPLSKKTFSRRRTRRRRIPAEEEEPPADRRTGRRRTGSKKNRPKKNPLKKKGPAQERANRCGTPTRRRPILSDWPTSRPNPAASHRPSRSPRCPTALPTSMKSATATTPAAMASARSSPRATPLSLGPGRPPVQAERRTLDRLPVRARQRLPDRHAKLERDHADQAARRTRHADPQHGLLPGPVRSGCSTATATATRAATSTRWSGPVKPGQVTEDPRFT